MWALVPGAICADASTTAADAPDTVVVGYFPEWAIYGRNYHVTNVPGHLLTHLNYAFLKPVIDGLNGTAHIEVVDRFAALEKTYPGDSDALPYRGNFYQLVRLKEAHPHLKTLLSVGGATLSDDFSDIAASASARTSFADSAVAFMAQYAFDGIDIDWEFPVTGGERSVQHRPEDAANLLLLLRDLRKRLDEQQQEDKRSYRLTIATSLAGNTLTNRYRLADISREVDWINVMAYNMTGAWAPLTGHQAPLHANPDVPHIRETVATGISRYLELGVPSEKVVLGVPLYGRGFKGVPANNNGLFQKHMGACSQGSWQPGLFSYRDLCSGDRGHHYLNANGFDDCWDPHSEASFLYSEDTGIFITYPSSRSLHAKARYVSTQQLRGMMCWSLDSDTLDHALVKAMYTGLMTATDQP